MGTCSSILAWKIAWTEEPGRLVGLVHGVAKSWRRLSTHTLLACKAVLVRVHSWPGSPHFCIEKTWNRSDADDNSMCPPGVGRHQLKKN